MKLGFKHLVLTNAMATAFAGFAAPVAAAQQGDNPFLRDRYTAVNDRTQLEYDPQPQHVGAFEIMSTLGASAEYNDNLYAEGSGPDDDTIVRLQPEIEARSTWSTHQLSAGLALDHNEHIANGSETVTNFNGHVGGGVDVQRSFQLNGRLNAAHITEPRYEPGGNLAGATEPAQYDRFGVNAGAAFRNGRIQLEGSSGITTDSFNRGYAPLRDLQETYLFGRGAYAVSPDVAFFVQARQSEQDYDVANRDGSRTSIQVGTSFELAAPFRGEIAVGGITEDKNNPALSDVDGLSADARVDWFLTQLTSLAFRVNSGVFDPGIVEAASAKNITYGVRVEHELRRNILLFGDVGFGSYEFEGAAAGYARKDKFTDLALGATYKLNRNARFEIEYRLHHQESSGADADPTRLDADQSIIRAGVRVFP